MKNRSWDLRLLASFQCGQIPKGNPSPVSSMARVALCVLGRGQMGSAVLFPQQPLGSPSQGPGLGQPLSSAPPAQEPLGHLPGVGSHCHSSVAFLRILEP